MEVKFIKDNILQLNTNKIIKNNRKKKIKIFKKKVLN